MIEELWLPVPVEAYARKYVVSNLGRVKNVLRRSILTPMRTGSRRPGAQRSKVRFSTSPRLDFDVSHLVLAAFVGPRPEGAYAMHLDDDSANNALANLKWGTPSDNMRDMVYKARGASQKLSVDQVLSIVQRRRAGEGGSALAREFNVSPQRVCDVYKGRTCVKELDTA